MRRAETRALAMSMEEYQWKVANFNRTMDNIVSQCSKNMGQRKHSKEVLFPVVWI